MPDPDYPALFKSADEASNRRQKLYLGLVGAEYILLLIAAIFSLQELAGATFYLLFAFIFLLATALLLTRALMKPEQDWYRCRALAESVKTLTWRYMMRAAPFGDAHAVQIPRAEFRNHLHRLFDDNRIIAEKIDPNWSADDQITGEMNQVRALNLQDRKQRYRTDRINNQRQWYAGRATSNKTAAKNWVIAGVIGYGIAVTLVLLRIRYSDWQFWPIPPVIAFASSVIGWMHVKKYSELGAAYTVAAHEIGLIAPKLDDVNTEAQFSDFVNDAELAFSREHTLWIGTTNARPLQALNLL
jgi:hypothetical protein